MRLHLLAFGKMRTPGLGESCAYYLRNLQHWVATSEHELKAIAVPDKSPASRAQIQEKEALILREKLNSLLSPRGIFYLLDEVGKSQSTQDWAKMVNEWEASGVTEVAFCLGSSLGFAPSLHSQARGLVSLGPQTLPHELARVVVAEQLYRAWSVTRGHPYHVQG